MVDGDLEQWDVVIVGAGVTGALMAWRLADSGRRVLVLEAGPSRSRIDLVGAFARSILKGSSAPYIGVPADIEAPSPHEDDDRLGHGHYEQAGVSDFKSTYERLNGGSTWHWLGNTPRHLPADFKMLSTYGVGVDWPLSYEDLEPWYGRAEVELGVSGDADEWAEVGGAFRSSVFPMPPIWSSYGDEKFASVIDGTEILGVQVRVRRTPQARNSRPYQGRPPCAGNSSCVPICPVAAKYDATVHIERAARLPHPPTFRNQCVVTKLVADPSGRISSVQYAEWTDAGTRRSCEIRGATVVLAAHAIETPLLLLASGLARQGPVGQHLMDHPQGYAMALLHEPVYPFRGPPVVCGIDVFRDGFFRSSRAAFRISIGNDGWGRVETPEQTARMRIFTDGLLGKDLRTAVNGRVTRMLRMSYSTEMLPSPDNHVTLAGYDDRGNPRPRITFSVGDYNKRSFVVANRFCESVFQRLGVSETRFSYPDKDFSGAGHIMGTCRMGSRASDSVTDSYGRVHEHPNLFITGAALFPTCGTANPTLTAAALALRTAAHLRAS